jgi:hypothetical protein
MLDLTNSRQQETPMGVLTVIAALAFEAGEAAQAAIGEGVKKPAAAAGQQSPPASVGGVNEL